MKGFGAKKISVNGNVFARNIENGSYQAYRKKLCWSCQKDKSTTGGKLKLAIGLSMFVCKECMDIASEKRKNRENNQ
jgi:hypothetical protein